MRHGWHFSEKKVMVRMTFPNYRNPLVQIFDVDQATPPESFPYVYSAITLPSLNRLLKVLQGWNVQALETGAWEWRKPAQGVTTDELKLLIHKGEQNETESNGYLLRGGEDASRYKKYANWIGSLLK